MSRTSFAGPVYSEGKPVVTQDQTTGELVGQIPIVYPTLFGGPLVLEGEFKSELLQPGGPAVDVPRNVGYGPGGVSLTGCISVDGPSGEITILKTGGLVFSTRLRIGRTGAAGVSHVVVWGERSIDGGAIWNPLPNVATVNLDAANELGSFLDLIPIIGVIGHKYRVRFARSSDGNNSGDLTTMVLGGGLAFLGTVPSAYLSVYRYT